MSDPTDKQSGEAAFNRWRDWQPYKGATDKERRAFLAGFSAGQGHTIPTEAEIMETLVAMVREKAAKRQAMIDAGTCPDCEGEGQSGGQFCGGFWKCEACSGSGRAAAAIGGAE